MFPEDKWVAAPVQKGDLVLIHGQVKANNIQLIITILRFLQAITRKWADLEVWYLKHFLIDLFNYFVFLSVRTSYSYSNYHFTEHSYFQQHQTSFNICMTLVDQFCLPV